MALTKATVNLHPSADPAAAAAVTEASVNITAIYGGEVAWKITNGAAAPTTAPTVEVQVSDDNVNFYRLFLVGGDLVALSVNSGAYPVKVASMYIRTIVTAGATNASVFLVKMEQISSY